MTRQESYDQRVEATEQALRSGGWWTAAELAEHLRCSKPTVYAHLRALTRAGKQVRSKPGESSETGPAPRVYAMKKRA